MTTYDPLQTYASSVDLQEYNAVVIYRVRFNAVFGVANEETRSVVTERSCAHHLKFSPLRIFPPDFFPVKFHPHQNFQRGSSQGRAGPSTPSDKSRTCGNTRLRLRLRILNRAGFELFAESSATTPGEVLSAFS
jgi:hypothetical protein